jgi:spore coat protein A
MSEQRLSRRRFLAYVAAGAGGGLAYLGMRKANSLGHAHSDLAVSQAGNPSAIQRSPAVEKYSVALPIPEHLYPDRVEGDTDYYSVSTQIVRKEILPGLMTTLYTYNGSFPGKTFIEKRNQRALVTVTNNLPDPISCHYHGGVTAPQHDGYAEDITIDGVKLPTLIQPGKSWTYDYPDQQGAATNWFHDHAIHHTAEHVYRGMAAMYLVRDDIEGALNLPQGEYEIPLVFQDRLFDSGGEFVYDNNGHEGVRGDVQLVNGAPWPRLKVKRRKYRFRLLNGSNWRRYDLAFTNQLRWIQIGTESGFLRAPAIVPMIRMFPGERNDVLVDFSQIPAGTTVYLLNRDKRDAEGTPMARVMAFEVEGPGSDDSASLEQLTANMAQWVHYEDLTTPEAVASSVKTRTFLFERRKGYYAINGKIWDARRFDANPRLGTTEIWHLKNNSGGWFHPIHIHLINFQILRRKVNGKWRAPELWERGRKDVVALNENEEAQVIIKWDPEEYLHFTGPYMMHCHNVDHEDHDMMTQFQVLPQA